MESWRFQNRISYINNAASVQFRGVVVVHDDGEGQPEGKSEWTYWLLPFSVTVIDNAINSILSVIIELKGHCRSDAIIDATVFYRTSFPSCSHFRPQCTHDPLDSHHRCARSTLCNGWLDALFQEFDPTWSQNAALIEKFHGDPSISHSQRLASSPQS